MKRRVEAVMSTFTDMIGLQTNKARALSAGEQQGQRAVVNSLKPTGVSVEAPAPVTSSTHPSDRTQSKLAFLLSPRSLGKASNGADNEHSAFRETNSNHWCADGRTLNAIRLASL
jgi:hypothetical protein